MIAKVRGLLLVFGVLVGATHAFAPPSCAAWRYRVWPGYYAYPPYASYVPLQYPAPLTWYEPVTTSSLVWTTPGASASHWNNLLVALVQRLVDQSFPAGSPPNATALQNELAGIRAELQGLRQSMHRLRDVLAATPKESPECPPGTTATRIIDPVTGEARTVCLPTGGGTSPGGSSGAAGGAGSSATAKPPELEEVQRAAMARAFADLLIEALRDERVQRALREAVR